MMADPAPNVTPIRADIGKPTTAHQTLWNQIDDRITAAVEPLAPRMGTVTGIDGGKVMVTLDNEKDDRTVALPRRKGVRYLPGDRVFVHQLHGGDEVIGGIVSSKAGVDPAVDSNQIFSGAIQRTHIASSAVGTNEIAKNVVDEQHFTPAFNTRLSNVDGPNGQLVQLGTGVSQNTAGVVDINHHISGGAGYGSGLAGSISAAQSAATAADAHAQNVYDLLNGGAAAGNSALSQLPGIIARLAKLETAAHNAGWSGF
jgi:hypothetical protein